MLYRRLRVFLPDLFTSAAATPFADLVLIDAGEDRLKGPPRTVLDRLRLRERLSAGAPVFRP